MGLGVGLGLGLGLGSPRALLARAGAHDGCVDDAHDLAGEERGEGGQREARQLEQPRPVGRARRLLVRPRHRPSAGREAAAPVPRERRRRAVSSQVAGLEQRAGQRHERWAHERPWAHERQRGHRRAQHRESRPFGDSASCASCCPWQGRNQAKPVK